VAGNGAETYLDTLAELSKVTLCATEPDIHDCVPSSNRSHCMALDATPTSECRRPSRTDRRACTRAAVTMPCPVLPLSRMT
jgi:hypothetical protein